MKIFFIFTYFHIICVYSCKSRQINHQLIKQGLIQFQKQFPMSKKYPYVAQQYQHLINASFVESNSSSTNINQYMPQNNIQYVPGNPVIYHNQMNIPQRYNHDSYAANEPNPHFSQKYSFKNQNYNNYVSSNQTPVQDSKQEIVHKIQYGDTLQGLSLLYEVSITKIKQRNKIQGDSIYYMKQIIIPNPQAQPLQLARNQHMYIEQFMGYMPFEQKSQKVAKYYLEEHNWQMQEAVKAFKQDLQWQRKNKIQINSMPINQVKKNSNYNFQQLQYKKLE